MTMFNIIKKEIEWGGRTLSIETGKVARQADGAAIVTYGKTMVLATVVAAKSARADVDFFPLSVHYMDKYYAAGQIPGGFFKREGRPTEYETLTSRLIDRPIRPLFHPNFKNETQVICTLLSHDLENASDIVALVATSAALAISGLPIEAPIGASRIGVVDGQYVLNPTKAQMNESELDLVVAGTKEGVLMVESEAKELTEDQMLEAVTLGHEAFQPVIKLVEDVAKAVGNEKIDASEKSDSVKSLSDVFVKEFEGDIKKAYGILEKQKRRASIDEIKEKADALVAANEDYAELPPVIVNSIFKDLEKDVVRTQLIDSKKRIDGRTPTDIRQIECEVGWIPGAHGSALFTRGETQAIVATTLGTGKDEQLIDALDGERKESFMLHYNFPPFSVGETGRVGSPGRREIGHGKLAWRSLKPVMPSSENFPYTIRAVSEITESNGSSSMATVCGTSLSMMHAGVPLSAPVAGIAMGLVKEGDDYVVLSDIMGDEDHLGDMDFKVAGTKDGITSLQMDIKITSITTEIMKIALDQANAGRNHILGIMNDTLSDKMDDLHPNAPRTYEMQIDPDKIRDVIGQGGKTIKEICEVTGSNIDIEQTGKVRIFSPSEKGLTMACDWIDNLTSEPEIGKIYDATVVNIVDFGAFVRFMMNKEGLVHISEICDRRLGHASEVLSDGQEVQVKVVGFERGKVRLSIKQAGFALEDTKADDDVDAGANDSTDADTDNVDGDVNGNVAEDKSGTTKPKRKPSSRGKKSGGRSKSSSAKNDNKSDDITASSDATSASTDGERKTTGRRPRRRQS